tara:strand:+ start:132 stop:452 length:321 start_codon:yes stop_codon:yes gene_type:complete
MREIVENYFRNFSNKNLNELEKIFSNDIVLKDWDSLASGKKEVLATIQDLFDSIETISINIIEFYLNDPVVICVIEVVINNKTKLNVIDIIKFNKKKIIEISAYKQ